MLGLEVRDLVLPTAVEELPRGAAGLGFDLILQLLARNVFVHEARAIAVELQEASAAHAGTHVVNHGGVGPLFQYSASKHAHTLAVSRVGHAAVGRGGREQGHDAVGLRGVVVQHLLVARDVARGEDDGLGVHLDELIAAGLLADNARDTALCVTQKLDGRGIEVLCHDVSGFLCLGKVGVQRGLVARVHAHRGLVAGVVLVGVALPQLRQGVTLGLHPVVGLRSG